MMTSRLINFGKKVSGADNQQGRINYLQVGAKNDEDAVIEGKAKFLKSAEYGYIPSDSVLLEIFQTPTNLLKKRCRIEEQKESSSFSLVLVK